jgi:hypothetical protein
MIEALVFLIVVVKSKRTHQLPLATAGFVPRTSCLEFGGSSA